MRSISQRELRNDSGKVMREVQRGASFQVTSRGTPIAVLAPIERSAVADLTLREGSQIMEFPPGAELSEASEDLLAELRGDR